MKLSGFSALSTTLVMLFPRVLSPACGKGRRGSAEIELFTADPNSKCDVSSDGLRGTIFIANESLI